MNQDVQKFVAAYVVCQQVKLPATHPLGLLQPLPLPVAIWEELSLEFIIGLPPVKEHLVIIMVVDRLSKYYHLSSLPTTYNTVSIADFFIKNIIQLHCMPTKLISDRDKVSVNRFWKELFTRSGTTAALSTAYHPKMDGQTKVVNKTIEGYL